MKKLYTLILILSIGQLLTSCLNANNNIPEELSIEEDFRSVDVNNQYSMSIPSYMTKTSQLNDVASLQYQNTYKEAYVVIIDELKEDVINTFKALGDYDTLISMAKNYRNIQLNFLSEGLNIIKQHNSKSLLINGLEAESVEIDAKLEGVVPEVTYFLTFIEGKENVYMSMAWTMKKQKKRYRPTFEKMIESFSLIEE